MDALELLDRQRRCLLAFGGAAGPVVVPAPCWSDGAHVWLAAATSLLGPDRGAGGGCALHVPGVDGGPALAATGEARIFGPADPVGLVLHGPAITAALAVLTAASAPTLAGYVQDSVRLPLRLALRDRAVVRVRLQGSDLVAAPPQPPGVAPPLPPAVPADVRRVLGGQRRVAVALDGPRPEILPGVLGAGFALTPPVGRSFPRDTAAAVVIQAQAPARPEVGLALHGRIGDRGALRPERVTWWEGGAAASADLPPTPAAGSGIVLPD